VVAAAAAVVVVAVVVVCVVVGNVLLLGTAKVVVGVETAIKLQDCSQKSSESTSFSPSNSQESTSPHNASLSKSFIKS
jgi:hypothetical protein